MSAQLNQEEFAKIASDLMATKMYSLASFVVLIYDIVLTFGEEVERIWMREFTWFTGLWILNRYISPLGYIVIIGSFHQPWSKDVCNRYILFPEALKVVMASVVGIIFIMRLYAIYSRNLVILVIASTLLVAELAIKIWAFTDGTSLNLPEGLVGCILVGKSQWRFVFTWVAELGFDTAVFIMTLARTLKHYRTMKGSPASLLNLILRDGIIYFAIIFIANAITVLFFTLAPPNIKAVNASFSSLITSLMVSRIILNLRGAARRTVIQDGGGGSFSPELMNSTQLDDLTRLEFRDWPAHTLS